MMILRPIVRTTDDVRWGCIAEITSAAIPQRLPGSPQLGDLQKEGDLISWPVGPICRPFPSRPCESRPCVGRVPVEPRDVTVASCSPTK